MRIICTNILLLFFSLIIITCKKKSTIKIKLFNPYIQEYVANAKIVLVERKLSTFGAEYTCTEIDSKITDANGACSFDKEKLKTNSSYQYYCAVKESWGVTQSYPCSGKTSGFIKVGSSQDVLVVDDGVNGSFRTQYNNVFSTAQNGDSLIALPERLKFENPKGTGGTVGGGGIFGGVRMSFDQTKVPYQSIMLQNDPDKLIGIIVLRIRKRKLGVLTLQTDTFKVLPKKDVIAQINW